MSSPSRRRAWIWFFVLLGILTVAAVSVQIWYNSRQLLTPAKLAEARSRWQERGPSDYDMDYIIKKTSEVDDVYTVHVRNSKVTEAARNGAALPERLYRYQTMPALFAFIEEFLERDSQPGTSRVFAVANFDRQDGHLIRYVRSVMSTRERQEITVHFHGL
jgi:hypothetical protein